MKIKNQLVSATRAIQFMQELLNAVECLSMVAQIHGTRTIVDLMYLQHAILTDGFGDILVESPSKAVMIIQSLPSQSQWMKYVRMDCQDKGGISLEPVAADDYYVIHMEMDVHPALHGPFESDKIRLAEVIKLMSNAPNDAFIRVTVPKGIEPDVSCFTGGEIDDELLEQLKKPV